MTGQARLLSIAALATLALAVTAGAPRAATAAGPAAIGPATIPVRTEGSVEVEFSRTPVGACSSCRAAGTLSWEPVGDARLEIDVSRHGRLTGLLVFFGGLGETGPKTTSHVTRTRPDGSTGTCSDARSWDLLVLDFSAHSPGDLEARLARGGPGDAGIFRTRCGGPIETDLVPALPSATLDSKTLGSGRTTIDLSGTRSFTAHGLSGAIRSSLLLRLGRPLREPPTTRFTIPRRLPAQALRTVTATYSVTRVSGTVETTFGTVADRSICEPLDACGATGSVRLEPLASSGKATFVAYGSARRTSAQALRAALGLVPGRRPRGVTALGGVEWARDSGRAMESFTDGFGESCSDSTELAGGFVTLWMGPRRAFAAYGRGSDFVLDPLRTRCPGPSLPDAAQDHPLAAGTIPRAAFRKPEVVIRLDRGRSFESEPYRGQTKAALTVVLRRLRVRDRVEPIANGVL
jgi:hypothetical protein